MSRAQDDYDRLYADYLSQRVQIEKLEAENALLKHSLAMLTKQLEGAEQRGYEAACEADDVDRVRS